MGSDDHADPDAAGQLHHVELSVPAAALERSLSWWGWLLGELGYETKNDWDAGRSWRCGPTYIVVKAAEAEGEVVRATPGLDHVAFHAASRDQVDRVAEQVRKREGSELLYPDRHPYAGGYYAAYVEGPSGITVEVVGPE